MIHMLYNSCMKPKHRQLSQAVRILAGGGHSSPLQTGEGEPGPAPPLTCRWGGSADPEGGLLCGPKVFTSWYTHTLTRRTDRQTDRQVNGQADIQVDS